MHSSARIASLVSIIVVTAAGSVFAQPEGMTGSAAGAGTVQAPGSAAPDAEDAAPIQAPGSVAPGAAPIQAPGSVAPGAGGAAAGAGASGSDTELRNGLFLEGSLSVGIISIADLRLGWVIGSRLSVFASLGKVVVLADDGGAGRILGVGARLWADKLFFEGRVVGVKTASECDFDASCEDRTTYLGMFGIGGEFIHTRSTGLELRGDVITDGRDRAFLVGFGLSFYL